MLKTILTDARKRSFPELWARSVQIPVRTGKIVTLSGVRRSGKTYHLYTVIKRLLAEGISPEAIVYFNFEDERLDLTTKELDVILQAQRELHPDIPLSDCYFFFDEIQEVDGWEKFIARLYHSISRNIYITGSNARLLSGEIASALRGRTVTFEIYPLSFPEYVRVLAPGLGAEGSADSARAASLFEKFLHRGGFPELVKKDASLSDAILQGYFQVMVLRDIIERYQVSQAAILKYFCRRVIASSAGEFSVNKIYNELKSQGYQVAKNTLYTYQEHVEAVYLSRFVHKFDESIVKSEYAQKKPYVIDQGLGAALDFKLNQDAGRLLETTIVLECIKQGNQIAYSQNGSECDIVRIERGRVVQAVQVAADVSDAKTKRREIKGLLYACHRFQLREGTIVTLDYEEDVKKENISIRIIPAWKWLTASGR